MKTGFLRGYRYWYRFLIPLVVLAFAQSAPANAEPATLSLYCKDNRLTVSAKDVSLRAVLEKIAQEAGISIVLKGSAENRVSAEFSAIGIEEGIKRLTRGSSHAFIYVRNDPEALFPKPMTVFIFSGSSDRYSIFGGPITASSEPTSERFIPDSEDPDGAFERLKEKAFEANEGALSQIIDLSLYGEKEETRAAAIEVLGGIGEERVMDALIRALDDDQAWVRAASVRAIGEHGGKRALNALKVALTDPVPEVRETARLTMDETGGGEQEEQNREPQKSVTIK